MTSANLAERPNLGTCRCGNSIFNKSSYCLPCGRAVAKKWRKKNPLSGLNHYWRYKAANRDKVRATNKLNQAVKRGIIIRPKTCSKCGVACKPHAHHEDYKKRFEVIWLCPLCHSALHREMRAHG